MKVKKSNKEIYCCSACRMTGRVFQITIPFHPLNRAEAVEKDIWLCESCFKELKEAIDDAL